MNYYKTMENVIYPLLEIKRPNGENIFNISHLLEKTQWWSPSELKRFQQNRLQKLIKHAYENIPYYHKIFKELDLKPNDIKKVDDLQKLPILKKEHVRNNLCDLTPINYSKEELIPCATGGSTGEPMRFFCDRKCGVWNMAAAYRQWSWVGYNQGDKIAYLWGALQDPFHRKGLKSKIFDLVRRKIMLDAFNITEKTMDEYVRVIRKFKPKIINAYTSAIYLMAHYIEKREIDDIRPKAILTSCEMLFDYQKDTIERAFGCDVFDYYSGRDTTLQAGECPERTGYHLAIENAVVEFIKDNKRVSPGEFGKIIITDLSNYATPFIRYEMGDLGEPSNEECPCGRGLPLMKSVRGRILDMITTQEGRYLTGEFFPVILADIKSVKEFQIIQKRKDKLLVKIIKEDSCSDAEIDLYINTIKKYVGEEMKIDLEYVKSIPLTSSGKKRLVISEIDIDI